MKNKQVRVLIVDDEEVMRSLFVDLLTERGCEVIAAKNGLEAAELAKKIDFAIAFIDVHMPIMNGLEVLRAIKKINPQTAIVMMDSYPDLLVEQSKEEGAITCIHKPFEIKEVIKIMDEVTEQLMEELQV